MINLTKAVLLNFPLPLFERLNKTVDSLCLTRTDFIRQAIAGALDGRKDIALPDIAHKNK